MKKVGILGSTGSIGTQSLDIMEWFPDAFEVELLAANTNAVLLAEQTKKFSPRMVAIADETKYNIVRNALPSTVCRAR